MTKGRGRSRAAALPWIRTIAAPGNSSSALIQINGDKAVCLTGLGTDPWRGEIFPKIRVR